MKKLIRLFIMFILVFSLTSCKLFEEEVYAEKIEILNQVEDVTVGEFDYNNYKFRVYYSNGTLNDVYLNESYLSSYDRLNILKAGDHKITVNIDKASIELNLRIRNKVMTDISFDPVVYTYTGEEFKIEATGDIPLGATVAYPYGQYFKDAGLYDVSVIISKEGYDTLTLYSTITIEKATYDLSTFTFENKTVEYNGFQQSLEIEGTMPKGLDYYYTVSTNPVWTNEDKVGNTGLNSGTYYVTLHISGDSVNHNTKNLTITRTLKIEKKDVDLDITGFNFENKVVVYDGRPHTITIDESKLPENVKVVYENDNKVAAGEYTLTARFEIENQENYQISKTLTAKLTILKAQYDMSKVGIEYTTVKYDGKPHGISISGNLPRGVEVDYYDYELDPDFKNGYTDCGKYEITVYFKESNQNHENVSPMTGILEIQKASFSEFNLSVENVTVQYDGEKHGLELNGSAPIGVSLYYSDTEMKPYNGDYYTMPQFKEVGIYQVLVGININYNNYENYVVLPEYIIGVVTINRRDYSSSQAFEVKDITIDYDNEKHGLLSEIERPEWVTITSYELKNKTTDEVVEYAIDAGLYSYSFEFDYFDGVEYKKGTSKTGLITINRLYLSRTNQDFIYSEYTEITYDNVSHEFIVTASDSIPNKDEFFDNLEVTITLNSTGVLATEIKKSGKYDIKLKLTNSKNYIYTNSDEETYIELIATYNIAKKIIDLSNVIPAAATYVTYDGNTHYPLVPDAPLHVQVISNLEKTEYLESGNYREIYAVYFLPEDENYSLKGNSAFECAVFYQPLKLKAEDTRFYLRNNSEEITNYTESKYAKGTILDISGSNVTEDKDFNEAYLEEMKFTANGNLLLTNNILYKNSSIFEKIETKRIILYTLNKGSNKYVEKISLSNLSDIELYINSNEFSKSYGTPFGEYYIFVEFSSLTMIKFESPKIVYHLTIEQDSPDLENVFKSVNLSWGPNVDNLPKKYEYNYNYILKPGMTIITKDFIKTEEELGDLYVKVSLNTNIYGISEADYHPIANIVNLTIDIKDVVINDVNLVYNELNRKNNWCSINDFTNVPEILIDLIENDYVVIECTSDKDMIYANKYNGTASFRSTYKMITIYNSLNSQETPKFNASITIEEITIEDSTLKEALEKAYIISERNGISPLYSYSENIYTNNVAANYETININNVDTEVLSITSTISYIGFNNYLRFSRNSETMFNSPVAGLNLVSFEVLDENFTKLYDSVNNKIRSTSLLKTNSEYFKDILSVPKYTEIYHLYFQADENAKLSGGKKTFDVYIKNTMISLYRSETNNVFEYNGEYHTIYVDNFDYISDTVSLKYKLDNGSIQSMIIQVKDSGVYGMTLYATKEDHLGNEIIIGKISDKFTINKKVIKDLGMDYYIVKSKEWTGEEQSSFETITGYNLPECVNFLGFTYNRVQYDEPLKFTNIGKYEITLSFEIKNDYLKNYSLDSSQNFYTYTFEITKIKVNSYFRIHYLSTDTYSEPIETMNNKIFYSEYVGDTSNLEIEYYIENKDSLGITTIYPTNIGTINKAGVITSRVTLDIPEETANYYILGVKNGENFTALKNSTPEVTYTIVNKLTNDIAKVSIYDDKTTTIGIVADNNKIYNTLFIDYTTSYRDDGIEIVVSSLESVYKFTGSIIVNTLYGEDDGAELIDDAITLKQESGDNKIYSLDSSILTPGEYYILFLHDTTIGLNNNYYINNLDFDYYIGLHLVITG